MTHLPGFDLLSQQEPIVIHPVVFPALGWWAEWKGRNKVGTEASCVERNSWERETTILAIGGFSSTSLPKSVHRTWRTSVAVLPLALRSQLAAIQFAD